MIRETELNLLVPSPELLVRLASGDRPMGVSAGPPRIRVLKETYFDTAEGALRRRAMTCKLKQGEGEIPTVVITLGEGPDSEGITSRSRLSASAVGLGVYETLRGDSEVAAQLQRIVDPRELRPQIALDIQRLGRVHRRGLFRVPVLYLFFDRITVQARGSTTVLHELRIRRRRSGGPLIRDIGQELRDNFHLFPDGLSTLQRAYRVLALERKGPESELSPYALSLSLALFKDGKLGLVQRENQLCIPTFRGSGEDAARALASDLMVPADQLLTRLGVTEPKEGRPGVEVWMAECPSGEDDRGPVPKGIVWIPWHAVLELAGKGGIRHGDLLSALLLLTRRRLLGKMEWIPSHRSPRGGSKPFIHGVTPALLPAGSDTTESELKALDDLLPPLRVAEEISAPLEARLQGVSDFFSRLNRTFDEEVSRLKGQILSSGPSSSDDGPEVILDLISVRVRGFLDRVYDVLDRDLLRGLEARDVFLRSWAGIMREDRRAILNEFSRMHLPDLQIVADWGPAFVPEMPSKGGALGLTARVKGSETTRFFHVILGERTPSFINLPGDTVVLPLEEVIRGYLFSEYPELERAETHLFRFRTAEVTVREAIAATIVTPPPGANPTVGPDLLPFLDAPLPPPEPTFRETAESVVTEVLVHRRMPEGHQVQLLRALERQVTRQSPLIGWSDLHIVNGPLDLSGLGDLVKLGWKA